MNYTSSAKAWLKAGNKLVYECECGQVYLIGYKKTKNITGEMQVLFFRYLLKKRDILTELGEP